MPESKGSTAGFPPEALSTEADAGSTPVPPSQREPEGTSGSDEVGHGRSAYGMTDFARMDAHEITAEEYEELPEITDAMIAGGVPGDGGDLVQRGRGRPRSDHPKRQVTLRLDADVIEAMRSSGPGWQVRANEVLRARFKR